MEKNRGIFILVLVLSLMISCSSKKPENKTVLNTNGQLKLMLYINPTKDCLSCTEKALNAMDKVLKSNESITCIFKLDENQDKQELENFKTYIKNKYSMRSFSFKEMNLKLPHPSVFLAKDTSLYMCFAIPMNAMELNDTLNLSLEFMTTLSNNR